MVVIRVATLEDAPRLLEIYAYYVKHTAITFEYEVPSIREFDRRRANTLEKYPYLVLEDNHQIKGFAYASAFSSRPAYDWICELSIYIDYYTERKGYGGKLYAALEAVLKQMGLKNLYACIAFPDEEDEYLTRNSADFHQHLGFNKVGYFQECGYKFEKWYHMIWMEKILSESKKENQPIIKFLNLNSLILTGILNSH